MRARRKAQTSRRARAPRSRPHAPPPPLRLCAVRVGWPAAAMSANLEEQEMELEALESIFMDDLRVVDATGDEGVGVECRCGAGQEGEARAVGCGRPPPPARSHARQRAEKWRPRLTPLGALARMPGLCSRGGSIACGAHGGMCGRGRSQDARGGTGFARLTRPRALRRHRACCAAAAAPCGAAPSQRQVFRLRAGSEGVAGRPRAHRGARARAAERRARRRVPRGCAAAQAAVDTRHQRGRHGGARGEARAGGGGQLRCVVCDAWGVVCNAWTMHETAALVIVSVAGWLLQSAAVGGRWHAGAQAHRSTERSALTHPAASICMAPLWLSLSGASLPFKPS